MEQIRTFGEAFGVLKRRFLPMAFITIMGTLAAIYYALNQPRMYETHAALQIESAAVQSTSAAQIVGPNTAAHKLTLIEQRLMARDSLERIIQKLGLFSESPEMPLTEKIDALRRSVKILQIKNGAQAWQPNVTPSGLLITVNFGDPQRAADIANEFLGSVLNENRKRSEARTQGALSFFTTEERRLGEEILALEAEIATFKSTNSEALPDGLAAQRTQLANLLETDLELDREIIAIGSNTARQRQTVVEQQIERLEDQKNLIKDRIARIEATLSAAPEVERQLAALTRRQRLLQDQYSVITTGRAQAEMGQQLANNDQTERFIVLETALVPDYPVSPSRKRIAMLGFLVSGFAACLFALALELANPAIRTTAQLERQLGLQPVVSIPYIGTSWQQHKRKALWLASLIATIAAIPVALRQWLGRITARGPGSAKSQ